ncbi:acyl-CoA carboxylase subunit epsilon [Amycolatopsis sp. CA-161197]|uniref:acyl-CoA carboxylase subunit epsilon n=1 Tax=unclassified Amycolatopsis TaxID=2618356 RepID=UPI0034546FF2
MVRIVRGNPTDEELAALVAVLTALQAPPEPVVEVQVPRPRRPVRFVPATSWQGVR